jgi:hypothetical protein
LLRTSKFHFPCADDREEPFAQRMFAARWEGPQTDKELELLARFFDPVPQYVAFGDDTPPTPSPLESWVFPSGWGNGTEAYIARDRALNRGRQLAAAREGLRLLKKYGHLPDGPEELECLDPGDDRQKLREARRISATFSQADVQPSESVLENLSTAAASEARIDRPMPAVKPISPNPLEHEVVKAAPAVRERSAQRKRGPQSKKTEGVSATMVADVKRGDLTIDQLDNMLEKQMEDRYGASRDTCRKARKSALATLR